MLVVGYWLPVTLDILFNLVKSVSIVLFGQFLYRKTHLCNHCEFLPGLLLLKNSCCFCRFLVLLVSKALEIAQ